MHRCTLFSPPDFLDAPLADAGQGNRQGGTWVEDAVGIDVGKAGGGLAAAVPGGFFDGRVQATLAQQSPQGLMMNARSMADP